VSASNISPEKIQFGVVEQIPFKAPRGNKDHSGNGFDKIKCPYLAYYLRNLVASLTFSRFFYGLPDSFEVIAMFTAHCYITLYHFTRTTQNLNDML
jgi:hypothetical protein